LSVEDGIFSLLTGDAAIGGLVGTRVYPTELPEGVTWPAILYMRPDTTREATMDTAGLPVAMVGIHCFDESPADVITLAEAVKDALVGYHGTAGGTKVVGCVLKDEKNGWDFEKSSTGLYWRELTFAFFYRE